MKNKPIGKKVVKVHKVIKDSNCYHCLVCGLASGDGDGFIGETCYGMNELLDIKVQQEVINLRIRHGLTQDKLAKLVGTKQESIARAESRGIASIPFLRKIADAVGDRIEIKILPTK